MNEQTPLPRVIAAPAVMRCIGSALQLIACRRVHMPKTHVGMRLRFGDGTSAPVFRETAVDRRPTLDPCVLVVEFRLRLVRGWGRAEYYARCLWRILEIGCEPASIHYMVMPGVDQNAVLREPETLKTPSANGAAVWWRPVGVASGSGTRYRRLCGSRNTSDMALRRRTTLRMGGKVRARE